jgi:hypothetical protein
MAIDHLADDLGVFLVAEWTHDVTPHVSRLY